MLMVTTATHVLADPPLARRSQQQESTPPPPLGLSMYFNLATHRTTHPPPYTKFATTAKQATAASGNVSVYRVDSYNEPHPSPRRLKQPQSTPLPDLGMFVVIAVSMFFNDVVFTAILVPHLFL
ncbi:hypothetical protein M407DRAFT_32892 [Tulasnella calospora MUT 4182]|uniref:Uncharacterized protein n=1 Tax=Tulasnella calospora MUT 4182 TaxID=1051891 RepID=A0A0C3PRY9_9AGAM|nr:hypothetical protein M407DRAFT_32892 [Tulasnella calospora MUT 4182]